jgi:hypothetical protein
MNKQPSLTPSLGSVLLVGFFFSIPITTCIVLFAQRASVSSTSPELFVAFFPIVLLISCVIYIARGGGAWFSASFLSGLISLIPSSLARGFLHSGNDANLVFLLWFVCSFVILQWYFLREEFHSQSSDFDKSN